jgi:hypothetical protein
MVVMVSSAIQTGFSSQDFSRDLILAQTRELGMAENLGCRQFGEFADLD